VCRAARSHVFGMQTCGEPRPCPDRARIGIARAQSRLDGEDAGVGGDDGDYLLRKEPR
jgi:hypothetical protein